MIEFRSVTKTYPDGTVAVADVSLVVPTSGAVLIDDEDVRGLPRAPEPLDPPDARWQPLEKTPMLTCSTAGCRGRSRTRRRTR